MVIAEVLKALRSAGIAGPGDIVAATGMPRYLVLASFKCLEELGLVEAVYAKGTHRAYRLTTLGLQLLEHAESSIAEILEAGLNAITVNAVSVRNAGTSVEEAVS
jgi:predicted transcriptional regulator